MRGRLILLAPIALAACAAAPKPAEPAPQPAPSVTISLADLDTAMEAVRRCYSDRAPCDSLLFWLSGKKAQALATQAGTPPK